MAPARLEDFREYMDSRRSAHGVPGAAVGILRNGHPEISTFGIASIESRAPVTPETVFQIGSITKTFTATALLRLFDQGTVDLDVPVRTYLPGLRLSDESAAEIVTLRHLLTHRGGFESEWFVDCGTGDEVLARLAERLQELRILVPPGTCFSYSSPGILIAGRVLEVVAGRPFGAALRDLILDPLRLDSLRHPSDDSFLPPRAAGHLVDQGAPVVARPSEVGRIDPASGGICSNVRDLLEWARFHLIRGIGADGEQLLQPATLEAMQAPAAESWPFRTWIGMPWGIDERDGVRVIGHGGSTWGFAATVELVPARDFALVILTNADCGVALMRELREKLLHEFAGLPPIPPFSGRAIDVPDDVLKEYAGRFGTRHAAFTLTPKGDGRLGVQVESRGYPRAESLRRFPPEIWAFSGPDQVFQEDPPSRDGARRVFTRDAGGRVQFLRGGSLLPRL